LKSRVFNFEYRNLFQIQFLRNWISKYEKCCQMLEVESGFVSGQLNFNGIFNFFSETNKEFGKKLTRIMHSNS